MSPSHSNLKTEGEKVTRKSIRPKCKKKVPSKSKTAPTTPLKSALGSFRQLNDIEIGDHDHSTSNSMETLPTLFGSPSHSRIRRLRSKHSQSLDRVWLPGWRESFNSRVTKRFVKNENVGGPSTSQYYYAGQSVQKQCHHQRKV